MADGAWSHTACLRADIHNLLAKEPLAPSRFNPFSASRRTVRKKVRPRPGAVEALARDMCGAEACEAAWGKPESADKSPTSTTPQTRSE